MPERPSTKERQKVFPYPSGLIRPIPVRRLAFAYAPIGLGDLSYLSEDFSRLLNTLTMEIARRSLRSYENFGYLVESGKFS
jgi:hypothetical protein